MDDARGRRDANGTRLDLRLSALLGMQICERIDAAPECTCVGEEVLATEKRLEECILEVKV